jgi:hypothetical protein
MPWDAKGVLLYRTIFPQMTNWLPDEEAAQLRFEFEAELARLNAALRSDPLFLYLSNLTPVIPAPICYNDNLRPTPG